jgi:hypothetical protein
LESLDPQALLLLCRRSLATGSRRGREDRFGPIPDTEFVKYLPDVKFDRAFEHLDLPRNLLV